MKLRLLKSDEVPLCYEGGVSFFLEGNMPGGFEPEAFRKSYSSLIDIGVGYIIGLFEDDGPIMGALGGMICPALFNFKTMSVESFWYVLPRYRRGRAGLLLFDEFERYSVERGAKLLAMIHLDNLQPESLRKLYVRRGYRLIESHYVKDITEMKAAA